MCRIWKRRSSDDVSILTYLLFLGGQIVYLTCGIRIRQWPLIVGMAAHIAGSLAVIGSALRFRAGKSGAAGWFVSGARNWRRPITAAHPVVRLEPGD